MDGEFGDVGAVVVTFFCGERLMWWFYLTH